LDWGNNTLGFVDGTFCCKSPYDQSRWDAEYYGSEGIVYMNDMTTGVVGSIEIYVDKDILGFPRGWLKPFAAKSEFWREKPKIENLGLLHWVDCVVNDRPPLLTPEQSRHVVELAIRAMKSAEVGRSQAIDSTFRMPPLQRFQEFLEGAAMPKVPKTFGLD